MCIADLLSKSRNEEKLSQDELVYLLGLPPDTADTYLVMTTGRIFYLNRYLPGSNKWIYRSASSVPGGELF